MIIETTPGADKVGAGRGLEIKCMIKRGMAKMVMKKIEQLKKECEILWESIIELDQDVEDLTCGQRIMTKQLKLRTVERDSQQQTLNRKLDALYELQETEQQKENDDA